MILLILELSIGVKWLMMPCLILKKKKIILFPKIKTVDLKE